MRAFFSRTYSPSVEPAYHVSVRTSGRDLDPHAGPNSGGKESVSPTASAFMMESCCSNVKSVRIWKTTMKTVCPTSTSNGPIAPPVANPNADLQWQPGAHLRFNTPMETVEAAKYVEQLFVAEQSWMTNRLSWLFVSQSFCIAGHALLVSTNVVRANAECHVQVLLLGIPLFGLLSCLLVGLSVEAAARVITKLADERARLTRHLNTLFGTKIPCAGVSSGMRDPDLRHTTALGSLPRILPWVLGVIWLFLIICR
jgi:hypothetical protein